MTSSPHGADDPREIVEDLETRVRQEANADDQEDAAKEDSPDLAAGDDGDRDDGKQGDVAPKVPGSPEPPD
ncbi:hypothetical protein P5P86_00760 [Nocardioides sp. BP30]|uniref:hypothetical protein n=1 Tax=Nocardioides sp. BP30 TaxID=3036374 RepID=UPI002468346B|nr:hypothetical protein [Nocardioides sp. BP30]WGL52373.1 hypothetical protein P5P86_00760 [Nocardioides sp. BP30]